MNILRLNFYHLDYVVTADLDRRFLIVSDERRGEEEQPVGRFGCWNATLPSVVDVARPKHA